MFAGFGRQLEGDLRQVDHHPIRIGEREGGEVDLLAQIDDKTRLLVVAADAHIGRDGERILLGRQPRAPLLSAAMPAGAPSSAQASVPDDAVARAVTNPDPLGPFLTH